MKYVAVDQMVIIEKEANAKGLSYEMMMENAGRGLATIIQDHYADFKDSGICGLIGSGNNGGDTLIALALLAGYGWHASAYLVRPRPGGDLLIERLACAGGEVFSIDQDQDLSQLEYLIKNHGLLLDGVLGTGFRLPLKPELADPLQFVKSKIQALAHPPIVIAVDCPSGVECNTGETAPETIRADRTITMAAVKHGLYKFPAFNYVGQLSMVGIGLPEGDKEIAAWKEICTFVPDLEWVRQAFPKRPLDAHKGTFGTALIVAGSVNYTGAAWLAGQAAYRIGSGLVTMAVPASLHPALAGHFPEATWLILPEEAGFISKEAVKTIQENVDHATAMLIGPGFGLRKTTAEFITDLFLNRQQQTMGFMNQQATRVDIGSKIPALVIDADGLKLLANISDWPKILPPQTILTPHPGEMSVLTDQSIEEIQRDRLNIAKKFSRKWGHIVILKGAFTIIADPDGQAAIIPIATPALARAGTGDVLAGLVVGLRAQGLAPFSAAVAGAWVHAEAGLQATKDVGNSASVIAGDIIKASTTVISRILN